MSERAVRILSLYKSLVSEVEALDLAPSGKSKGVQEAILGAVKIELSRALFKALVNATIDPSALTALRVLRVAGRIDEDREGAERSEIEARGQVGR
ncbi:MAG: hypothetical protein IPJ61_19935 [Tessaracoccus sp.]|uniref:hypothetical protein n=1 Tax=Tessaracoccus sp. TaxID=1971211 RepID=UPI001EC6EA30|nr:hypothetical protein [Tessaracoccus sp.]MBK7823257.1 hypothetical protein [Tessaracoccus sp.]